MARAKVINAADPKKKKGTTDIPVRNVLVVDFGSNYTAQIIEAYKSHSGADYKVDVVKSEEVKEKDLSDYHIIDLSGSRRKKNLDSESATYALKNAGKDTYVIGRCYGAQVMAKHHGVDSKRLDEHQKGKQEITYKDGTKGDIHKDHRWGIQVSGGSGSKLEHIASSEQKFDDGTQGKIYEVFRAKQNPKHIGIQGHSEKDKGHKVMYTILDEINEYQQAA